MKVLQIDASVRTEGSVSRPLTRRLATGLVGPRGEGNLTHRELNDLPLLSAELLAAVAANAAERTAEQRALAALPDQLIEELEAADAVVIGVPIYNFGIPAALKAWIDLVTRARRTFRYGETGPVGLLADRPVYLVVASGGTALDSSVDFATPYLRHALGFIGLRDVRVIDATGVMVKGDAQVEAARTTVEQILATAATSAATDRAERAERSERAERAERGAA